jgi:hypothetical protein
MNYEACPGIGDILYLRRGNGRRPMDVIACDVSYESLGGAFPKHRIEAITVSGGMRERRLRLVTKRAAICNGVIIGDELVTMTDSERYYERWRFLRKNSIPTASSMRVADRWNVVMGDMTIDGSEFFGKEKYHDIGGQISDNIHRSHSSIERIFLGINPLLIKKEIERIQMKLFGLGVRLPYDDRYDLLVHPDGNWEVLVIDLSLLSRVNNVKEELRGLKGEREMMFDRIDAIRERLINIVRC